MINELRKEILMGMFEERTNEVIASTADILNVPEFFLKDIVNDNYSGFKKATNKKDFIEIIDERYFTEIEEG